MHKIVVCTYAKQSAQSSKLNLRLSQNCSVLSSPKEFFSMPHPLSLFFLSKTRFNLKRNLN